MAITRAQIKYQQWLHLNKSPTTKGFYTDEKANSVVQQSLDGASVQMFLADEGWSHKIIHMDVQSGQVALPVPPDVSMIVEVRYLTGNVYMPLTYDQNFGDAQWSPASGAQQFPGRYRLVDNNFYFNPPINEGGPSYLQVEYNSYPPTLKKDGQALPQQFDNAMMWWMVFHGIVVLTTGMKMQSDWAAQETFWWTQMINMIGMRTRQCVPIREFDG